VPFGILGVIATLSGSLTLFLYFPLDIDTTDMSVVEVIENLLENRPDFIPLALMEMEKSLLK